LFGSPRAVVVGVRLDLIRHTDIRGHPMKKAPVVVEFKQDLTAEERIALRVLLEKLPESKDDEIRWAVSTLRRIRA